METAATLRELADVIDLIDQLGAQLEAAWIRHGELCAAVDASSTLVLHRRRTALDREIATAGAQLTAGGGLDKGLDKALDKVEPPPEVHQPAAVSAPAPAPIVTSSSAKVHQLRPVAAPAKLIGTNAQAILQLLADGKQASAAELIEALVADRGSSRQSVYQLIKTMAKDGKLRRVGRGLYSAPPDNAGLAKPTDRKSNAGA